jgi:copper chaperone CopZ
MKRSFTLDRSLRLGHWVVLVALVASSPLRASPSTLTSTDERRTFRARTVVFQVRGMSCGRCATSIEDALGRIDGVLEVRASAEEGRAVVRHDPRRVDRDRLERAIRELEYEVDVESEA